MSTNFLYKRLSLGLVLTGLTLIGCSTSSEHPGLISDSEETSSSVSNEEFGVKVSEVTSYFASCVSGSVSDFLSGASLDPNQIPQAQEFVWGLWTKAVKRNSKEKLPALTSHYRLSSWGAISHPDDTWILDSSKMYIFYGSKGERPEGGYPLFLFLHGSGTDAKTEWTVTLDWNQRFDDGPCAYFVPKSPYGGTNCRWYQPSRQEKWEQVIRQAMVSDDIDSDKIYFAGISEGAYGTQRLASFYPDYIAGAAPIAGGDYMTDCPPENLATLAFCMQTGGNDTSYGRDVLTKKMGESLDALAASFPGYYVHKVDLQPGATHASTDYTVATPWVSKHSRPKAQNFFHYENLALGGINGEDYRYRDAFFNIKVIEPSDSRSDTKYRTVYEMNVSDNVVDLTVQNVSVSQPSEYEVVKTYAPAKSGKVRVYLGSQMLDLNSNVIIKVNGKEKFNGKLQPDTKHLIESCALFYDPARIYPAAVDVTVD